jgi:hypothetical protein
MFIQERYETAITTARTGAITTGAETARKERAVGSASRGGTSSEQRVTTCKLPLWCTC